MRANTILSTKHWFQRKRRRLLNDSRPTLLNKNIRFQTETDTCGLSKTIRVDANFFWKKKNGKNKIPFPNGSGYVWTGPQYLIPLERSLIFNPKKIYTDGIAVVLDTCLQWNCPTAWRHDPGTWRLQDRSKTFAFKDWRHVRDWTLSF